MENQTTKRKTVKIYVPRGSRFGDNIGYVDRASAEESVKSLANWYPNGHDIEECDFDLPADSFWTNDLISVELHRGGHENDDGIHHGGGWTGPVYGLARVSTIHLKKNIVEGWLVEPGTDKHIQSMPLKSGLSGYPYRNAKLVRANDVEDFQ